MSISRLQLIYDQLRLLPPGRYYVHSPSYLYIYLTKHFDYIDIHIHGEKYVLCGGSALLIGKGGEKYEDDKLLYYPGGSGWKLTNNPVLLKKCRDIVALLEQSIQNYCVTLIKHKPEFIQ